MSTRPRALPPRMARDAVGHALYARVTSLPQFTAARAEAELVRIYRREILSQSRSPREIVDLRAGSAVQPRPLLRHVSRFIAVDPCRAVLDDTLDGLNAAFPELDVRGIVGDASFGLGTAPHDLGHRLILLLESALGSFDPTVARLELARIRGLMEPDDRLLIGMDLAKDGARLGDAYDDASGVYAAYVRNALRRVNREVGTDFRSADWSFVVDPQPNRSRVEIRFEARVPLAVEGGLSGVGWDFMPGDPLVIERAYKPSEGQVAAMAISAGLRVEGAWTDSPTGYGLFLLAP